MMDMNPVQIVEQLCAPFEDGEASAPGKRYVKIDLKDEKFGGMKMSWSDLPGLNRLGSKSFWVAYERIDEATYLNETKRATGLPANMPGHTRAESVFWADSVYTESPGKTVTRGQATLPPNLFYKFFVADRSGFYRINEIGSWDRDTWGSLSMASILNGIDCMLRHESGRAEGWLKPSSLHAAGVDREAP